MYQEPRFDDPSRTADHGYFPHESLKPVVLTGEDLANAIETGIAPDGAPFSEWVPKLDEGCRFQPIHYSSTLRMFKAWLSADDPLAVTDAMDRLNDVAFENYGGEA